MAPVDVIATGFKGLRKSIGTGSNKPLCIRAGFENHGHPIVILLQQGIRVGCDDAKAMKVRIVSGICPPIPEVSERVGYAVLC